MKRLDEYWYHHNMVSILLFPLSLVFLTIVKIRHFLYRIGILKSIKTERPIIVIGNINVGGTGKTPLVIWLVNFFKKQGFKPGIISRGYGGNSVYWPRIVNADSDPETIGDEPMILFNRCQCPVVVGPDRIADIAELINLKQCDVILSDDGLQHYRMARDIEISVIDGKRRFGNQLCLPAGPLREPVSRLKTVDFLVTNGEAKNNEFKMEVIAKIVVQLNNNNINKKLDDFKGLTVHAVAGIGNPDRFFNLLKKHQLTIIKHVYPDHHQFKPVDIEFSDDFPVIMTEKDAVKCQKFSAEYHWYLSVEANIEIAFEEQLTQQIKEKQWIKNY